MTGITRTRHDTITAHAAHLLTQAGGITHLDSLPILTAKSIYATLSHQLSNAEGCTYETARRHIARACRRARHPDYQPPAWGGNHTKPQ